MSARGNAHSYESSKVKKRKAKKKKIDINKIVNVAVKTGKVIIGTESLRKFITSGDLEIIILSENCPAEINELFQQLTSVSEKNIPILIYPFSSWELGAAAGKPFMIASLGIIDEGDSDIIKQIKKMQKISA
ncbi:MAG: 50S ribosomal protein L30e [Promethearchaeota archaeon]